MATSRIGRKPVKIPSGVEVKLQDAKFSAKGPKGNIAFDIHNFISVVVEGDEVKVSHNTESRKNITGQSMKLYRSILGTVRANIFNAIYGVSTGFEEKLNLVGVGYKAQAKGKVLSLSLGHSHPDEFPIPEGITIETPVPTEILIKGSNKETVGKVAANIRRIRSPEPYKGKGVRYAGEKIELKETKKK